MSLTIVPVTFRQACQFIAIHHRHHRPPSWDEVRGGCPGTTGLSWSASQRLAVPLRAIWMMG